MIHTVLLIAASWLLLIVVFVVVLTALSYETRDHRRRMDLAKYGLLGEEDRR